MKSRIQLFCTAFLQVSFVAMNVIFIAHAFIVPMLLTSFMISFIWTLNVKKVAFGNWGDRITYAIGAMVGNGVGYAISTYIMKTI
jgi:hypothetical protein